MNKTQTDMIKIEAKIRERAAALLQGGEISYFIGWEKGRFAYQSPPFFAFTAEDCQKLVWDEYCINNLAKYLLDDRLPQGKIGLLVRGCDSRAINRLLQDQQIKRENVYLFGLPCEGKIDHKTGQKAEKCLQCTHGNPVIYDEFLGKAVSHLDDQAHQEAVATRFSEVERLEDLSADERYAHWSKEYSKCIRCYACRNVCPACNCRECYADQYRTGWQGKQNNGIENQVYGMTRAYHVAGRCIECGECQRVCPVGIPLMSLNRKLIKDINDIFGDYEAGLDLQTQPPGNFYCQDDPEKFL